MILPVHAAVRSALQDALARTFNLDADSQPPIVIETPPSRALGDLAVPIAFELARRLRKAPRAIASELAAALGVVTGVERVVAASNGYLNFFLARAAFLEAAVLPAQNVRPEHTEKVIVEHTAINPNKAAHVGHLRNATLGDTIVRLLRFQGRDVEVQNYIDDTGVQVADVVVGFTELEGRDLAAVRQLATDPDVKFDFYCWDLYARVTEWYEGDKARLESRARALHEIEEGGNASAEMGAIIADRIVHCHLATMARLGVAYDLLTWEGDILRLHFWTTAFDQLKARGAVFLQTEGRLKGCWVMPIEDVQAEPDEGEIEGDAEQREKVIVRSNGTVTYVGKDIANQFWKFGLLGRDFHYRVFESRDGRQLWATTSRPEDAPGAPAFGRAKAVYNVIDSRQSYLQSLLKQALASMGFNEQAERSTHVAYEMVALSHATARALGYEADDSGKPFVEVSGRKGLGVKADDLLDRLVDTAKAEVASRHPDLPTGESRAIAEQIATAAVRYFLIKFSRGKVIAFDIEEALSFEGETGPYLQYSVVRANNIFTKLRERDGVSEADMLGQLSSIGRGPIEATDEDGLELWNLVLEAGRLDEIVEGSIRALEPAVLAKYAFGIAQMFNAFYHRQSVLNEVNPDARVWRAAAVAYWRRQMTRTLELMGCSVPARM
jgi:arginyl-tRNA synthetase